MALTTSETAGTTTNNQNKQDCVRATNNILSLKFRQVFVLMSYLHDNVKGELGLPIPLTN